ESTWLWLRWLLGFGLYFLMISYNYYILPTEKVKYRKVIPGSVFAAVGLLVVTGFYSRYTTSLADYDVLYGALSSVVAIMFWFYFLAWVLCLGVLFNKVWDDTSEPFSKMTPPARGDRY
ncbi:MAG: YihY/virulence factor BrkB family protein, partial [Firmicutes bacterium]|nr:YihY/virulence factor BrkB family protein [Bacillota bacterium]